MDEKLRLLVEAANALAQLRELETKDTPAGVKPLEVGKNYIIRTVTYHYTGRLKAVTDGWLVLSDAAWIADSGRWANALRDGTLSEVEPYPGDVMINRAAVVDVTAWTHALPREQR